ncbi:pyrroline-5-carboxylate reductase [Aquimarina sp. 2201CG14-23]|uniref:pyrroline-5-carboxylate reductase n=1 Tax=Aquimarina mycalae TaxID=3040073 RepID=UPI002477DEA4|nr:pyrroline-5-carboxylate reductase [Aquimarina sp. 2201CG14-23]MDH7448083.1 pyrroline-5-carboxylate reductase [Aquimarina sp. 2201CG14-23]
MDTITIIGGGNLGKSIISGLSGSDLFEAKNITVVDKSKYNLKEVEEKLGVSTSQNIPTSIKDVKWVILCVQPRQLDIVLQEIKDILTADQILISTVTGTSIEEINAIVPNNKVVRVMPNTGAAKKLSMTCIAANNDVKEELAMVEKMFDTIGETLIIEERLMQAATVLGASGIAFFLRFLRAMIQGGIQMGFHPHEAQIIAVQTAIGAATLVAENGTHPEREIDKVTTPQGCTIEGLNEMEHQGLSSSVIKGVMASYEKINTIK